MDTIQCAVVLAKLERFDAELAARAEVSASLPVSNADSDYHFIPVRVKEDRTSAWAQLTLLTEQRDQLIRKLKESGVPAALHYPLPLNRQAAYGRQGDCEDAGDCPEADRIAGRCLSVPCVRSIPALLSDVLTSGMS